MNKFTINRAPVLSLWSFVVARRLGYSQDTALSLAKAIIGMRAYAKAESLGLVEKRDTDETKHNQAPEHAQNFIEFMGRSIPIAKSPLGPLALRDGKPISPTSAERYIAATFGQSRAAVHEAMVKLARSRTPPKLAKEAFRLYKEFRPSIPAGVGSGKAGILDIDKIKKLAG